MTGHRHIQTHLAAGDKNKNCFPAWKGTFILPALKTLLLLPERCGINLYKSSLNN